MRTYSVALSSPASASYRCTRAANSQDINLHEKLTHQFTVRADLDTPYNVGLIVGSSGSGKSTLAARIFGNECFTRLLDPAQTVLDQFPAGMSYDECAGMLVGVGLSQVPCWLRPARTLSNGQRERAEVALQLARMRTADHVALIDEWTSVVDRTVARVMSHCIAKHTRRVGARLVLCSCHRDVVDWLNPDWVIDTNRQSYEDRREVQHSFERSERLAFDIRPCDRAEWKHLAKYHYLTAHLPPVVYSFGLFEGVNQVGFCAFTRYNPKTPKMLHISRTVVHPDYLGLGLGVRFSNECARYVARQGFAVRLVTSQPGFTRSLSKSGRWALLESKIRTTKPQAGKKLDRGTKSIRTRVRVNILAFKQPRF